MTTQQTAQSQQAQSVKILTNNQVRELLKDWFMSSNDIAAFFQEVKKEQYTAADVMKWLGA